MSESLRYKIGHSLRVEIGKFEPEALKGSIGINKAGDRYLLSVWKDTEDTYMPLTKAELLQLGEIIKEITE